MKKYFIFIMLFCFIFSGLLGCSNEAKKERHWKRGEKYFSENKFREAIIEYKNVIQNGGQSYLHNRLLFPAF
jgi:uncharacterized lipoprotein NlpE involved in copper resistance